MQAPAWTPAARSTPARSIQKSVGVDIADEPVDDHIDRQWIERAGVERAAGVQAGACIGQEDVLVGRIERRGAWAAGCRRGKRLWLHQQRVEGVLGVRSEAHCACQQHEDDAALEQGRHGWLPKRAGKAAPARGGAWISEKGGWVNASDRLTAQRRKGESSSGRAS